ncbi:histidinol dehydrogenase [Orbaceae bacterium ESL0721]|nr:histidinol dehydrogenase [Orbaceae bacterium ESL0721]
MKLSYWNQCNDEQKAALLMRPAVAASETISQAVTEILTQVKSEGDAALKTLSQKFDSVEIKQIKVTEQEINAAADRTNEDLKQAMQLAVANIKKFHQAQQKPPIEVETMPGIECQLVTRPIKSVGLYIPGGSAPLFSTVLMLATPAHIAGCRKVILCSPPPIADEILYAAKLCNITEIYQLGGAQAIAAMAFGTESVPKVAKIFGPGNAYVTEAKRQVNDCGVAIDMPAGPSEVLVIADSGANPAFIAADLLSQAEHGPDSQVILLTPDEEIAKAVAGEVDRQLATLSRQTIAEKALQKSRLIVAKDLDQCIDISNRYGPEHLIIQTRNADKLVDRINSAGSIFLGDWSPESAGDYASGTNHVLPTYGYTATYSSLGLADFQKRMTIQKLSPDGLKAIGGAVELMAQAEKLTAHKQAVSLRLAALNSQTESYKTESYKTGIYKTGIYKTENSKTEAGE